MILQTIYQTVFDFMNVFDTLYLFIYGSILYALSYGVFHLIFLLFKKYREYSRGRKFYILSNFLKFISLILISFMFTFGIASGDFPLIETEAWIANQGYMKNMVCMYAITDFVALVISREKMMWSTIFHHICVVLAFLYVWASDLSKEGIFKATIVYGGFSSIAYLVNNYLAVRFLNKNKRHMWLLKKISMILYSFSCTANWLWQCFYLCKLCYLMFYSFQGVEQIFTIVLYFLALYMWIKDDIILIRYLYN